MEKVTKDNLLELLQLIKYPGFSRDIVSFGMIKDIRISDSNIDITLFQSTNDEKILAQIKNSIVDRISKLSKTISINVQFSPSDSHNTAQYSMDGEHNIKNIIAIASGKGGVGKSTIAINLASELSKIFKVGLLDLDIYGPSLPTLVGCNESPKIKENNTLIPIDRFGMKLMSFGFLNSGDDPAIWRGPMVSKLTNQFFDNVEWGELDFLILDLPPGTGDIQLTLVQKIALTGAIIITTPQDLAHKDVQKGSDMFNKVKTPILGVIENMSYYALRGSVSGGKDYKSMHINIDDASDKVCIDSKGNFKVEIDIFKGKSGIDESKRLGIPLIGKIPLDPRISLLSDSGTPVVFNQSEVESIKIFSDISSRVIKLLENN